MAGITVLSGSKTTTGSGTSYSASGWIRQERVTLSTTPAASNSYVWTLTNPNGSSSAKAYLSDTTASSPNFIPDVGGTYVVGCKVDGTTDYSVQMTVLDTSASESVEALRFAPRANSTVGTPSIGLAIYYSSDAGGLVSKNTNGDVAALDTGNPTIINFTDPGSDPSNVAGRLYWRDSNLNLCMGGSVVRQLGEEIQVPLTKNNTGTDIANGTAVYLSGALGSQPTVAKANNNDNTASKTLAFATQDIANNASGYCTTFGVVRGLDTSEDATAVSVNDGDEIFLGTSGGWLKTKPYGKSCTVSLGRVLYAHNSDGTILANVRTITPHETPFGLYEARPLTSSSSYSNLHVWYWNDLRFDALNADKQQNLVTTEVYRDTPQLKEFARHDRDTQFHIDAQMPHTWAQTDARLHVHLIPMAAGNGDAYFSGQYFFAGQGDETPATASWTSYTQAIALTSGQQYTKQYRSVVTCAAPASPGSSDILSIFLQREGTDPLDTYTTVKDHGTAAANLCIESIDLHIQELLVGSEEEFSGVLQANPSCIIFDPDYHRGDIYLRMAIKSDAGNSCSFQLYDVTGGAAVSGSSATTTTTSYEVVEVGPLTLTSGARQYRVQAKYDSSADEPKLAFARFVVR